MTNDLMLRKAMLDWINGYCNQNFKEPDIPPGVELALKKMIDSSTIPSGVSSQSVGGVSVSYSGADQGVLREVEKLLSPYVKMKVI